MDAGDDDTELGAERRYLRRSQRALRGMREQVERTTIAEGDPFADKVTNAYLRLDRQRRLATFAGDDGSAPLFFARVDHDPHAASLPGQRVYLGRRHVREAAGDDPLVVDWRAEVARPFYRAHPGDPMGLVNRRRFGHDGGELTAFEDEPLTRPAAADAEAGGSGDLLRREIERPRSGPMRDIVATIQPEQDEIVRADLGVSICVQGAPGTGKTAVGLHRAAYLLYTYREQLKRSGVLVVGPNRAFLGYIAAVLPSLGEFTVTQTSVADLPTAVPVRAVDPDELAALKGDARMADVLARALSGGVGVPTGPVRVATRMGLWTIGTDEAADILAAVRGGSLRYGAGREMLGRRFAAAIRLRAEAGGHSFTDGALETLARSRPIRDAVAAIWPKNTGAALLHRLYTDPAFLEAAADGLLDADEQRLLRQHAPAGTVRTARWSLADAYCVDEAQDLIERVPAFGHVIVDEAQDLSALQCRALGRRCDGGSVTVLGDLAQGTTAWASTSWAHTLEQMGKPTAHLEVLTRGYRVPAQILSFANRLLPHIAPELSAASSARSVPGSLTLVRAEPGRCAGLVLDHARRTLGGEGVTAVIAADGDVAALSTALADAGLPFVELGGTQAPGRASLVPASLAKGLEFDHVVLVEPAAVIDAEHDPTAGLRRLYVALTRAVTSLAVIHTGELPVHLRSRSSDRTVP
ncbi:DNA helicase [Frankia canadensis]|uniref:DNA helicase n=1 Tax=Frankia canadensis TaxID=1836972 RepID=A0A2I2L2Q4_9ACTN|nr:ATP-binding domain-containing protein [Frankia canadensis]SNQ52210.1 DNA helicase [Frankia canadensis]SOU59500.1 DNA helicase [Frankia canadensis]